MQPNTHRSRLVLGLLASRPLGASALVLLCSASIASPLAAQGGQGAPAPHFLVSTTNDPGALDPSLPLLDDTDLMIVGGGALPAPWYSGGHWRAIANFAPRDVDAVATVHGQPRAGDFYTSFLSDEGGFEDGDVVALLADGTLVAAVEEEVIAAALGDAALDVDVDAIAFEGGTPLSGGRMYFSLADNATSPTLGTLLDGDVYVLDATGAVARVFSEQEVTNSVALATGSSAASTDTLGLEFVNGELWATVQSPSSHDGAVIALGALARVVAEEADLRLAGEEIDALALIVEPQPCLWFETAPGGYTGRGAIQHGTPGGLALVLASGASGWLDVPTLGGFGAFGLSGTDPLLVGLLSGPVLPMAVLDATGAFAQSVAFDPVHAAAGVGGAMGLSVQVLDLGSLRLTPPFRILP
jgi:hypothetical protein